MGFLSVLKNQELKKKILYTLFIIALVRVIQNFPIAIIDLDVLNYKIRELQKSIGSDFFRNINVYTGKALENFTIGVLGIIPYITASIIMQLCSPIFPKLKKMQRESQEGLKKYLQITRYLTIFIALAQAYATSKIVLDENVNTLGVSYGLFQAFIIIVLTSASIFIMWLGEKISRKGIGNGASVIITIGIISSLPQAMLSLYESYKGDKLDLIQVFLICFIFIAIVIGTILIIQGERRIAVQYMVKQNTFLQNSSNFLPLKVNYAGVMPIIFATPILLFCGVIAEQFQWSYVASYFDFGSSEFIIIYSLIVFLFTFFWVATQFDPLEISDSLSRSGGFIPGYATGQATANFLNDTMTKITTGGAFFLVILAIFPMLMHQSFKTDIIINQFFGGTSLLIIVGVILQTVEKVKAQLLQDNYEKFKSKSLLRGRS